MSSTPTIPGVPLIGYVCPSEINRSGMEREMRSYLEQQLNVESSALKEFELMVRRDFKGWRATRKAQNRR